MALQSILKFMEQPINYLRVEKAIHYIKNNYRHQPSLEQIAQHVCLSKFHFQRLFENWAGVSPKSFIQFLTVEHAKKLLEKGQSTLATSYDVGLSGTGRLHDLFVKIESVSPGQYKNKGENLRIVYGFYNSQFGVLIAAETNRGLCEFSFITDKSKAVKDLKLKWGNAILTEKNGRQAALATSFFNKTADAKEKILLDLRGTGFQIKVWQALLKIPCATLRSYGDIARMVGQPKAARAIGSAIGKNPIAYIIPCHRVIRETGETGQYRWGALRKTALIGWESAQISKIQKQYI